MKCTTDSMKSFKPIYHQKEIKFDKKKLHGPWERKKSFDFPITVKGNAFAIDKVYGFIRHLINGRYDIFKGTFYRIKKKTLPLMSLVEQR